MTVKEKDRIESGLRYFDLLGHNETALSKAFSFTIGKSRTAFYEFIKLFRLYESNSIKNFKNVEVHIERHKKEGRIDIEILSYPKYQIIIECKVRKNYLSKQRKQYLTSFDDNYKRKILCFLTQDRDTNKQIEDNVEIYNLSWSDIIYIFNKKQFIKDTTIKDFLKFLIKNYEMNEAKEILIQDLGDSTEIERYVQYNVYRRDMTFGTPLYFAPYFTIGKYEIEGIPYLSRILGILTIEPDENINLESELGHFTKDQKLINKWKEGIKLAPLKEKLTFYFLDEPYEFKNPLVKDKGKHKGVGKRWIALKIPKNRTVSFIDFIKHIPEIKENGK